MHKNRVVVTGVGVVSSVGIEKRNFWENILNGISGISLIEQFNTDGLPSKYGGEIKNFYPERFIEKKRIKKYGRASQLAIAAAKQALMDAGLAEHLKPISLDDVDVIIGTTMGESRVVEMIDEIWVTQGEEKIPNEWILQTPSNLLAANVAYEINTTGQAIVIPTACAAGNYAIGYGFDLIQMGFSKRVLVGGADSFSKIAYLGFNRLFAMAPEKCCPFDKNRRGMLLGEGAGFLVLELLDEALKRKADIYAEVKGYGLSCDASHMTIPSESGISNVIRKALQNAQIQAEDVDYISAHGTGTLANDKTESAAITNVFGERKKIPVSSIKSMLGHTMGAASAIEAIACCLAIKESKIPPTINHELEDSECAIDCVPNKFRLQQVQIALNNSFAFGGNNACVIFSKYNR